MPYSTSSEAIDVRDHAQRRRKPTAFADRCRAVPRRQHAHSDARRNLAAGRAFQAALAETGLAGLTYAKEYGGAGLTLEHERIYRAVAQEFPPWPSSS